MSKAFANKKKIDERPEGDLYQTPKALTIELLKTGELDGIKTILECSCGRGAISNILKQEGYDVTEKDLMYGNDFLVDDYNNIHYDAIITNPPFKLWDDFVYKSKQIDTDKIIFIGRVEYFGAYQRLRNGIWTNLSDIYIFDRKVNYNDDIEKLSFGCMTTGWFVWKKDYVDNPKIHFIDIQKYVE